MEILRSRSVAEGVVDSLGLRVSIVEPRGVPRDTLFGSLHIAPAAQSGTYVIRRDSTAFSVTSPNGQTSGSPYGMPLDVGGLQVEPLPLTPGQSGPAEITLAVVPTSAAAEAVRGGLRVTRPQANAGIVALAYQSTDPVLAMRVVNGVAQSYIDAARHDAERDLQRRGRFPEDPGRGDRRPAEGGRGLAGAVPPRARARRSRGPGERPGAAQRRPARAARGAAAAEHAPCGTCCSGPAAGRERRRLDRLRRVPGAGAEPDDQQHRGAAHHAREQSGRACGHSGPRPSPRSPV